MLIEYCHRFVTICYNIYMSTIFVFNPYMELKELYYSRKINDKNQIREFLYVSC